jgi:micrococcal nuclease
VGLFGGRLGRGGWVGGALLLLLAVLILLDRSGDSPGPAPRPSAEEAPSGPVHALVTRVVDGDTIEVRFDGREEDVRYIGIDTPETVAPDEPVQCFGPRASAFNHGLVEGKTVRLVFDAERRDVYGRLLAYVYLGRRFVNAVLMRLGFARTLTIAPNDRFAPLFARLEQAAGRAGRGLWSACPP